jgi:hypothetical protein
MQRKKLFTSRQTRRREERSIPGPGMAFKGIHTVPAFLQLDPALYISKWCQQ